MSLIDPAIVAALRAHQTIATGLGEWCCKCSPTEWRPTAYRSTHVAEHLAPLVEAARAEAWDEGYATCLGDFDIAARRESRSPNPHRSAS